jgi:hypothetical protein
MPRARIWGRLTNDTRELAMPGEHPNNRIESWISFDAGENAQYTAAITTNVAYNEIDKKIYIDIDMTRAMELNDKLVVITINGQPIKNRRDLMKLAILNNLQK